MLLWSLAGTAGRHGSDSSETDLTALTQLSSFWDEPVNQYTSSVALASIESKAMAVGKQNQYPLTSKASTSCYGCSRIKSCSSGSSDTSRTECRTSSSEKVRCCSAPSVCFQAALAVSRSKVKDHPEGVCVAPWGRGGSTLNQFGRLQNRLIDLSFTVRLVDHSSTIWLALV